MAGIRVNNINHKVFWTNNDEHKLFDLEKEILSSKEWLNMVEKMGVENIDPVPVRINPKMNGNTIGRAYSVSHIEMAESYYERRSSEGDWTEIKRVIKHELAHIFCFANRIDRGHGITFKEVCGWVGLTSVSCKESTKRYTIRCTCGIKAAKRESAPISIQCYKCSGELSVTESVPKHLREVALCMECSRETPRRHMLKSGRWVCDSCHRKLNPNRKKYVRPMLPKLIGPDGTKYLVQRVARTPRFVNGRRSWTTHTKFIDDEPVRFWYDEMWGTYFYFKLDDKWWKTPMRHGIVKGYDGMEFLNQLTWWKPKEAEEAAE
jgi:predicted SprT family Zn-dependent metalloprotease